MSLISPPIGKIEHLESFKDAEIYSFSDAQLALSKRLGESGYLEIQILRDENLL